MRSLCCIFGLLMLFLVSPVMAADSNQALRIIIKYKQPTSLLSLKQTIARQVNVPVQTVKPLAHGTYVVIFTPPKTNAAKTNEQILAQLRKDPTVKYAVKDRVGHFKPLPQREKSDEVLELSHELQWDEFLPPGGVMLESAPGLRDGAWAYTTGKASPPIVVAVLDTGIEPNPALINNILKDEQGNLLGWNFAGNNRDLHDETESYHGTHVAGTIAGYGSVITGMGENLKILPLKIPDATGMFYESQVIEAIYWASGDDIPHMPQIPAAKVINMSFGVDEKPGKEIDHCDEALQEAIFFARSRGTVLIAAAGNDVLWEHYNAPAVCNNVVKVASTGLEGFRAYYSNYGPSISYAAPGGDILRYGEKGGILSTVNPGGGYLNSGFAFYQGTSMASPHAAGIAALLYAIYGSDASPRIVEQTMYSTTHDFGKTNKAGLSCTGTMPCGHGILDAKQAVFAAMMHFDVLFSAPKATQSCAELSKQKFLTNDNTTWKLIQSDCQAKLHNPSLEQSKDGQIKANYGTMIYTLDTSKFRQCQVIGFDGVGCYY